MNRRRRFFVGLFLCYSIIMLWLLFVRRLDAGSVPYWDRVPEHINLVPLRTIRLFVRCLQPPLRSHLVRMALVNLAGNILMFLPLGLLPPLIFPGLRKLHRTMLAAAAAVCTVEIAQMLLLVGTCDIDDLILNLLGTAIGYGCFRLISRAE